MKTLRDAVIDEARSWIGTRYVHQASTRNVGCDCLGLIRGVWRGVYGQEPLAVPAYSADWSEASREERLWKAARQILLPKKVGLEEPGDVLLFRMRDSGVAKHLAIAADCDQSPTFIHAYSGHGVIESSLSLPWRRRIVARFSFPERID